MTNPINTYTVPSVSITTARTGASAKANELGMRPLAAHCHLGLGCNFRLGSGFGRLLTRCDVAGFFAGGKQFRGCLDAVEVGMHRLSLKRGAQQRQVIERQLHQRKNLRACRSTAIEHAVEQTLDLPAEFA